ncbi:MAG: helix-turn-helix domain-containing protein [Bacteroidales bacterium]
MKAKAGRKPNTSGINAEKLKKWIGDDEKKIAAIKCQALISLSSGNSVADVCKVFNVTRESIRIWRNIIQEKGPEGLISQSKRGRKSNLSAELKRDLKKVLAKPPYAIGYKASKWSGKVLCLYLEDQYGLKITNRTAQLWMKKI